MSDDQHSPPGRSRRVRPGLLAGAAAVVVAGAAAGTAVVLLDRGTPPHYDTLPRPCSLVTTATLAKYLPEARSSQVGSPETGTVRSASCMWTSTSGGQDRDLTVTTEIYDSASAVPALQRTVSNTGGVTVKTIASGPVPGLGDQAVALAAVTKVPSTPATRILSLSLRSGNAEVDVFLSGAPVQPTGTSAADAARQDGLIATADDTLAALADPAAAASRAVAPAAPSPTGAPSAPVPVSSPQYTEPRDTCKLVTATTLATYLPGATVVPGISHNAPGPSGFSACGWNSPASDPGASLTLSLDLADSALGMDGQSFYQTSVQDATKSTTNNGTKTTPGGTQRVSGLGDQATAVFQTQTDPLAGTSQICQLILWSGNAEVQITFIYSTNPQLTTSPPPMRSAQVTAATAVARDVLATLPKS